MASVPRARYLLADLALKCRALSGERSKCTPWRASMKLIFCDVSWSVCSFLASSLSANLRVPTRWEIEMFQRRVLPGVWGPIKHLGGLLWNWFQKTCNNILKWKHLILLLRIWWASALVKDYCHKARIKSPMPDSIRKGSIGSFLSSIDASCAQHPTNLRFWNAWPLCIEDTEWNSLIQKA